MKTKPPSRIRVTYPRKLVEDFKKAALGAYPKETYAVFFGVFGKDGCVRLRDAWYPDDAYRSADRYSTDHLFNRKDWLSEALAIADSEGLLVLADAHSHPDTVDRAPSEDDWDGTPEGWIHAVCAVHREDGKLVTSMKFWPSIPKVVEQQTKRK